MGACETNMLIRNYPQIIREWSVHSSDDWNDQAHRSIVSHPDTPSLISLRHPRGKTAMHTLGLNLTVIHRFIENYGLECIISFLIWASKSWALPSSVNLNFSLLILFCWGPCAACGVIDRSIRSPSEQGTFLKWRVYRERRPGEGWHIENLSFLTGSSERSKLYHFFGLLLLARALHSSFKLDCFDQITICASCLFFLTLCHEWGCQPVIFIMNVSQGELLLFCSRNLTVQLFNSW